MTDATPARRTGRHVRREVSGAPSAVRWIVETLEGAGYEAWAVGGAVRDALLGHGSVDWDFTTSARPADVRRLFRRTVPVGIEHGTVGVLDRRDTMHEVTTFRKDVETFGRHAVVEFADHIDDDLSRRDFTINAIAWHPIRDELHDPFDGIGDLEEGRLRTVGRADERFQEDYLRVVRAFRFAGRFDLEIDPATWTAAVGAVSHLSELSPERVREELMKILSKDPFPSAALTLYRESGVLEVVYPELAAEEPHDWHAALRSVDAISRRRPVLRLAALLHDVGADPAAALMTRLRFSNADADRVVGLVRVGADLPPPEASPAHRRRWLATVARERISDLIRLASARSAALEPGGPAPGRELPSRLEVARAARALRAEARHGSCLAVDELELDGRDLIGLGLEPGPRFGEILDALLDRVLEEPDLNRKETLETLVVQDVAPDLFEPDDGGDGALP